MDANTLAEMLKDGRARIAPKSDRPVTYGGEIWIVTPPEKTAGEKIAEKMLEKSGYGATGDPDAVYIKHPDKEEYVYLHQGQGYSGSSTKLVEYIAAAIDKAIAHEREACAKICDEKAKQLDDNASDTGADPAELADRIRARAK